MTQPDRPRRPGAAGAGLAGQGDGASRHGDPGDPAGAALRVTRAGPSGSPSRRPTSAVVVAFGQLLPRDDPRRRACARLDQRSRLAAPARIAAPRRSRGPSCAASARRGSPPSRWIPDGHRPLLLQRPIADRRRGDGRELAERLAALGAEVLSKPLDRWTRLAPRPQDVRGRDARAAAPQGGRPARLDGAGRSLAARVRVAEPVAWARPRRSCRVSSLIWRARRPWAAVSPVCSRHRRRPPIGTGAVCSSHVEVQPENRRPMAWEAYLRGARLAPGRCLARRTRDPDRTRAAVAPTAPRRARPARRAGGSARDVALRGPASGPRPPTPGRTGSLEALADRAGLDAARSRPRHRELRARDAPLAAPASTGRSRASRRLPPERARPWVRRAPSAHGVPARVLSTASRRGPRSTRR